MLICGEHLYGFSQDIHAVVSHGYVTCLYYVHTRSADTCAAGQYHIYSEQHSQVHSCNDTVW